MKIRRGFAGDIVEGCKQWSKDGAGEWNRTTELGFTNSIEHRSIVRYTNLP